MKKMTKSDQYLGPRPEALKKIKHIVVVMLENRSFDNLLGWLYADKVAPRGQDFEGLNKGHFNPLQNIDSNGNVFTEQVYVRKNGEGFKLGSKQLSSEESFTLPNPDPGEGYRDATHQLYGVYEVDNVYPPAPTGLGYVENYKNAMLYGAYSFQSKPTDPREIMTCYTPKQTPVLSKLAQEFAVCDQWSCSVPSLTLPNRDFVHAATSNGYVNNKPDSLCDVKTIYNQIQEAIDQGRKDLSWAIYSGTQKDKKTKDWHPFSLTRLTMKQIQDDKFDPNFKITPQFFSDAKKGKLPSYSFIEPQLSGILQNDQHPPSDIRPGERFIADIYNAIKHSKARDETLLVITYDEHGGCYDHYTPTARAETPDSVSEGGQMGFRFNRFGVRVPAVVVSSYIKSGTIARPAGWTPFDHTSIIATVRNCFGIRDLGPLTKRDGVAPDLSCLLTRSKARSTFPEVKPRKYSVSENAEINDLQRLSAEILAELTGKNPPPDEKIHKFMYSSYSQHFSKKKAAPDE